MRDWQDRYRDKITDATTAVENIRRGTRLFGRVLKLVDDG